MKSKYLNFVALINYLFIMKCSRVGSTKKNKRSFSNMKTDFSSISNILTWFIKQSYSGFVSLKSVTNRLTDE